IELSKGSIIYPNFPLESGIADVVQSPMPLAYVTAGDFIMGSDPATDPYYLGACDLNEETPPHKNRTGDYYIGRLEITNGQFAQFMADDGYSTQSYWASGGWTWKNNNEITAPRYWNDPSYMIGDDYPEHPVGGVSWYEAAAYCRYIGGRLPHESEWEKSGRGADGRIYTYGDIYDSSVFNSGYWPEPVGSYPQSDSIYGVSDLCGNIFEWTADGWEWGLYTRYASGSFDPPTGTNYALQRGYKYLIVGDCDQDYATRLSYRDTWPRTYRWSIVGFRVAFDPPI
ncbi:MAG TPA: formylglycine-generating enzyme family protein, partial [Firmicutes bacterium]|nr:formylglycine-generating enzyme family protein [Bacillota bacterium]